MVVVALAVAVAYELGVRTVQARGGRWPVGRRLAFGVGVVAVAAAVTGPVDSGRPVAHVAQHLLLGMAAPLLFALGAPVTLALRTASPAWRRRVRRALATRAAAAACHPLVSFPLFVGTLFVLYLTPLLEATERHAGLHVLLHVHFLVAGALFLWPLVSPDPVPARLPPAGRVLLAFLTVPAHAVLGMALLADAGTADERSAAGLLWAAGDVVGLAVTAAVLAQWYRRDSRTAATPVLGEGSRAMARDPSPRTGGGSGARVSG